MQVDVFISVDSESSEYFAGGTPHPALQHLGFRILKPDRLRRGIGVKSILCLYKQMHV